jgi:uncharacterized tellurite resistance protein B-like protein
MDFSEILSLFNQGKGSARSHMKNLIEMAAVDGNFNEVEYELLKRIAKQNGISEGKLNEIRSNPTGISFEIPKDKNDKFHQLYDLVHMMMVDKAIHHEEAKLSNLFAVKFGYPREKIKDLVEAIRLNIENGQAHEETMKRVVLMLN